MRRFLRKGVLFTLLYAGVVAPAAADPVLMLLLSIARNMIEAHVDRAHIPPAEPVLVPDMALVYPGTAVEPDHLRSLIDDSFPYLASAQREEIFNSLNAELKNPKNAAVRGTMIRYFSEKALTVRAAQAQLAKLSTYEMENLVAGFGKELKTLSAVEQAQLGVLLRAGLLPVPRELNQMLLSTFEAR